MGQNQYSTSLKAKFFQVLYKTVFKNFHISDESKKRISNKIMVGQFFLPFSAIFRQNLFEIILARLFNIMNLFSGQPEAPKFVNGF